MAGSGQVVWGEVGMSIHVRSGQVTSGHGRSGLVMSNHDGQGYGGHDVESEGVSSSQ